MAKKTTEKPATKPEDAPAEVKATEDEKRMAVVLCRGHLKKQPVDGQLAYFEGLSVRQRNAAISRLRKLSAGERTKFLDELNGKPPAEAGESEGGEAGGDDGSGASK